MFFLNIKQVGGYKGPANFGIRELSNDEQYTYCENLDDGQGGLFLSGSEISKNSSDLATFNSSDSNSTSFGLSTYPPLVSDNYTLSFRADFEIRLFLSGCYYYDLKKGVWKSDGMEILSDSTARITHCQSIHLTDFGSGFKSVLPSINFAAAFANADFLKNPVIYSTIMVLSGLYIILAISMRYLDVRDKKKLNIEPLPDNLPEDNYFYEISVLTGSRINAGTDSKVLLYILVLNIFMIRLN